MARNLHVLLACALLAACSLPSAMAQSAKPACLTSSETRKEIASRHLLEPFAVLKSAAAPGKTEALSAKLCRLGEEYVYEIALLHHDGRLERLMMNAATGKILPPRVPHEQPRT